MKPRWCIAGLLGLVVTAGARADVNIKASKEKVDFLAGDELVTTLQIDAKKFSRPIFWPLHAPGKIAVTRAWPMEEAKKGQTTDHPHQKSCWFTWGEIVPEGIALKDKKVKVKGVEKIAPAKHIDFWAEGDGRIVCTKVGEPKVSKSQARVPTMNEWRTSGGTKVMDESRVFYFYDFGKARLLVFDITLTASVCPIIFDDTKEGAMGVRVHDEIMEKAGKGKIQNAEGKVGAKQCWGQISAWCDYSGPLEGKTVGVAILCDPKNPHPSAWHTRDYGLHAANPFGRQRSGFPAMKGRTDLVRLAKGESIHFRYGVLVHEGDAESGRVADYYQRFVKLREMEKNN